MTFSGPHLIRVSNDQVVIKRGVRELLVSGAEAADVAALVVDRVAGASTLDDLFADVHEPTRTAANRLLSALEARRLIGRQEPPTTPQAPGSADQDAFFRALEQEPQAVRAHFRTLDLTMVGNNPMSRYLIATLESMGMGQVQPLSHPDLDDTMVGWTDGLQPSRTARDEWRSAVDRRTTAASLVLAASCSGTPEALLQVNRRAVSAGSSFLPIWLDSRSCFVGPLVISRESGCLRCWVDQSTAVARCAPDPRTIPPDADPLAVAPPPPDMADATAVCGPVAAMEILKFATRCAPSGVIGRVVQMDPTTAQFTSRRVLKMPRCPDCSEIVGHRVPSVMTGPQIPDR